MKQKGSTKSREAGFAVGAPEPASDPYDATRAHDDGLICGLSQECTTIQHCLAKCT